MTHTPRRLDGRSEVLSHFVKLHRSLHHRQADNATADDAATTSSSNSPLSTATPTRDTQATTRRGAGGRDTASPRPENITRDRPGTSSNLEGTGVETAKTTATTHEPEPEPTTETTSATPPEPTSDERTTSGWKETSSPSVESWTPATTSELKPPTSTQVLARTSTSVAPTSTWVLPDTTSLIEEWAIETTSTWVPTSTQVSTSSKPNAWNSENTSAVNALLTTSAISMSSAVSSSTIVRLVPSSSSSASFASTQNKNVAAIVTATPSPSASSSTVGASPAESEAGTVKLAPGAIAGIAIACIVAILLAIVLFLCSRRRNQRGSTSRGLADGDHITGFGSFGTEWERKGDLKRSGTQHSALDFSDDPVSPTKPWRGKNGHLGVPMPQMGQISRGFTSHSHNQSIPSAPTWPLVSAPMPVSGYSSGRSPGSPTSMYPPTLGSNNTSTFKYDDRASDDDHERPPLQERDTLSAQFYDDWLTYTTRPGDEQRASTMTSAGIAGGGAGHVHYPRSNLGHMHARNHSDATPDNLANPHASNGSNTPPATPRSVGALFDAYGNTATGQAQAVLQRLPWVRHNTPPPVPPIPQAFALPSIGQVGHAHHGEIHHIGYPDPSELPYARRRDVGHAM